MPEANDNIKTAHLKCSRCGVQLGFDGIGQIAGGAEVRTFTCTNCGSVQELVIATRKQDVAEARPVRAEPRSKMEGC